MEKQNYTDKEIEKMWDEFEDVLFIEDENVDDCCHLALSSDWKLWEAGTSRDEIWRWFNVHHSKGLQWLTCGKE